MCDCTSEHIVPDEALLEKQEEVCEQLGRANLLKSLAVKEALRLYVFTLSTSLPTFCLDLDSKH